MTGRLVLLGNGLVVLVGMPCAGKSTFAAARCEASEVISFDALSALAGSRRGTWAVMQTLVDSRLAAGKRAVLDYTNLRADERAAWRQLARANGARCGVVACDVTLAEAMRRNGHRAHPLSDHQLHATWQQWQAARAALADEEWDQTHVLGSGDE